LSSILYYFLQNFSKIRGMSNILRIFDYETAAEPQSVRFILLIQIW
jgi:hypothetical protein